MFDTFCVASTEIDRFNLLNHNETRQLSVSMNRHMKRKTTFSVCNWAHNTNPVIRYIFIEAEVVKAVLTDVAIAKTALPRHDPIHPSAVPFHRESGSAKGGGVTPDPYIRKLTTIKTTPNVHRILRFRLLRVGSSTPLNLMNS